MKNRTSKTWTLLASLAVVVGLGLATAALSLAQPAAPSNFVGQAPLMNDPLVGDNQPGPLDFEPTGPIAPEPDPTPDPTPDPVDPDSVVILKPGQQPGEIDAGAAFTGDASYTATQDGQQKVVVIVAGRTVDQYGNPVPGAAVSFIVDANGVLQRVKSAAAMEQLGVSCETEPVEQADFPAVSGFSDKNGRFRLRVSYYTDSVATRDGWLRASRHGYLETALEGVTPSENVTLSMTSGATLTGRCVDEHGNPAAGVAVYAWGESNGAQATTDENGRFTIENLRGGELHISCWSDQYLRNDSGETISLRDGEENNIADLQVETRTSADFQLSFASGESAAAISGCIQVCNADGALVQTAWFSAGKTENGYSVHALLDSLAAGGWTLKLYANGKKNWKAEIYVCVSDHAKNDLGSIYMNESDEAPPPMIQKCYR